MRKKDSKLVLSLFFFLSEYFFFHLLRYNMPAIAGRHLEQSVAKQNYPYATLPAPGKPRGSSALWEPNRYPVLCTTECLKEHIMHICTLKLKQHNRLQIIYWLVCDQQGIYIAVSRRQMKTQQMYIPGMYSHQPASQTCSHQLFQTRSCVGSGTHISYSHQCNKTKQQQMATQTVVFFASVTGS